MHIIIFHPDPRLTISTLPAPAPHTPRLRSIRHLCSADLQPQGLIKLQIRNQICIRIPRVRMQSMTRFRRKVCRLVQTLVQELPQTPLPEQSAAVHSSPAVVSALVRLPVQLFARLHVPVSAAPSPAL